MPMRRDCRWILTAVVGVCAACVTSCASMAGTITPADTDVANAQAGHARTQFVLHQAQDMGTCLAQITGADAATLTLALAACDGSAAQTFDFANGHLQGLSQTCLTQDALGGAAVMQPCGAQNAAQNAALDGATHIQMAPASCLGTQGARAAVGAPVITATCTAADASQLWTLTPAPGATADAGITPTSPTPGLTQPTTQAPATTAPPGTAGGSADAAACASLGTWDAQAVQFEAEALSRVNAQRALGATCPGGKTFGPAKPVVADTRLQCEARAYAQAMQTQSFFSHTGLDGSSPFDRMTKAGVHWIAAAENIASGQTSPEAVVAAWMSDAGHCENLMGDYALMGVGFYRGLWVQDFATE